MEIILSNIKKRSVFGCCVFYISDKQDMVTDQRHGQWGNSEDRTTGNPVKLDLKLYQLCKKLSEISFGELNCFKYLTYSKQLMQLLAFVVKLTSLHCLALSLEHF